MQRKHTLQPSKNAHQISRYHRYSASLLKPIPPVIDLRNKLGACYDQGQTNGCTANAIAGAIQLLNPAYRPSRMFIYWNERSADGDPTQDNGSTIQVGLDTTKHFGVCPAGMWPYTQATLFKQPPESCYNEKEDAINKYQYVNSLDDAKQSLAQGFPVIVGMAVYPQLDGAEIAENGILTMPGPNDTQDGGHAVLAVGYNDETQQLIIRNSWGTDWGIKGYFYMPYAYAENPDYVFEMWSVQKVGIVMQTTGAIANVVHRIFGAFF